MKKRFCILLSFTFLILLIGQGPLAAQDLHYPPAKRLPQHTNYHGVHISDSYQWMEQVDHPEVQNWMKAQDETLSHFLDQSAALASIEQTMNRFNKTGDNYAVPQKGGAYYFYSVQKSGLPHRHIYRKKGLDGKAQLLLDMNEELAEGENFAWLSASPDGQYLVIRITKGQAAYGRLRIFNVAKKQWYPESLDGTTTSNIGWTTKDGFYYLYYGSSAALNEGKSTPLSTIKYHQIKSAQSEDLTVLQASKADNEPLLLYTINHTNDYQHLVIKTRQGRGDKNKLYLLEMANNQVSPLIEKADHMYNYVGSKGKSLYFYTNKNAPNGKIIALQKNAPGSSTQPTIVPEQKESLAGGSTAGGNAMTLVGNHLALLYREGTQTQLRVFNLQGEVQHQVPLETGWIGSNLVGDPNGTEVWFSLNTFLSPSSIYRMDLSTGDCSVFFDRNLPLQRSDYTIRNTYYESFDGTKVPIYICHKKDLVLDGSNPVFMYAYGFGGWVATPWYQAQMLTFIEMGGIYVLPGIRGGGEFGDAWRDAGIRLNRQNAIDDYLAAAEYLVEERYTQAGKIVANGWSASGSLAAAVTIQRPDLFGAALIGIPSLDMLRYEQFTAFKGWTSGYGSPENAEDFFNLYRWSPYHNLKTNTCYPPILVTVGEKDPTTPPQHGYKFVAALQALQQACHSPALLKIVWGGGHGFGLDQEQRTATQTQELAFLTKVLELPWEKLAEPKEK